MPKGDEEEIAGREGFFRFVALLAPRALLERPTLNPSLIRDQLRADGEYPLDRLAQMLGPCLGQCAYANLVGDARLQSRSAFPWVPVGTRVAPRPPDGSVRAR